MSNCISENHKNLTAAATFACDMTTIEKDEEASTSLYARHPFEFVKVFHDLNKERENQ